MFGSLKRLAVPCAAVMVLGAATAAQADPFTYTTSGSFTATAPDTTAPEVLVLTTTTDTLKAGGGTNLMLGFQAAGDSGVTPDNNVLLGRFILHGKDIDQSFTAGNTFTLNISQTVPGIGGASSSASITGSIDFTAAPPFGGADDAVLKLTFSPNPVLITAGGVTLSYKIANVDVTINDANQPFDAIITLTGAVSTVPLPGTAAMGVALIGGLGLLRRRTAALI